jgi:quercetin dioxygenase-like cupin family protein
MIRCVRLSTGPDGASHVEIGRLDMRPGRNADLVSAAMAAAHVTVEETAGGGSLAWHTAPVRQLVVTLAGDLSFTTRDGEEFALRPGDVLLAEDVSGSGHQWQLQGTDPWRRMYVVLAPGTEVPFVRD